MSSEFEPVITASANAIASLQASDLILACPDSVAYKGCPCADVVHVLNHQGSPIAGHDSIAAHQQHNDHAMKRPNSQNSLSQ